ncbi:MAG: hypothetical protein WAT39_04505 [Planctomycetota bacterium]
MFRPFLTLLLGALVLAACGREQPSAETPPAANASAQAATARVPVLTYFTMSG